MAVGGDKKEKSHNSSREIMVVVVMMLDECYKVEKQMAERGTSKDACG